MGRNLNFIIFLILLMLSLHLVGRNLNQFFKMAAGAGVSTPVNSVRPFSPGQVFLEGLGGPSSALNLSKTPFLANPGQITSRPIPAALAGFVSNSNPTVFDKANFAEKQPRPTQPFWFKWKLFFKKKNPSLKEERDAIKETFMQVSLEDTPQDWENPLLSHRDKRTLQDYLNRLRADDLQLAQDVQDLFGKPAREETIQALLQTERALEAKAKTTPTLADFFEEEEKLTAKTEKKLNSLFNQYRQSLNQPKAAPYNTAQWKEFFRQYDSWKRQEN